MPARRIAVLGNHTPRQCGIATFTEDLAQALADGSPDVDVVAAAMNDGRSYAYPARVRLTIEQDNLDAYEAAADDLNACGIDVLSVQHEFGIFGGPAGSYLLTLLRRVRAPVVTTLHTVLERFTPEQLTVVEELALLSARIVVMSERAVRFLVEQGVPREKVAFIHHGVHVTDADRDAEKARLGLPGRTLILTFGLLSPDKGIRRPFAPCRAWCRSSRTSPTSCWARPIRTSARTREKRVARSLCSWPRIWASRPTSASTTSSWTGTS